MSKGLRRMYNAVQVLRDPDPELQLQTVACFLLIADADEDIHMRDLQEALGMPSSSTSRNVAALSKHHRLGKAGLDLVEAFEDLADRRFKRVRLTPKGKGVRARIVSIIGA